MFSTWFDEYSVRIVLKDIKKIVGLWRMSREAPLLKRTLIYTDVHDISKATCPIDF